MLLFVFGAGASYDSDPDRRPGRVEWASDEELRPPLAAGLFTPGSRVGREVIANFPRAAPLLMNLRQATRQGWDVEEVVEQIAMSEHPYPQTAPQLLAFRAYLAQLMHRVPGEWMEECQGLTNYVLALDEADRWNTALHGLDRVAIACVTFNYDTMLEEAAHSVFGHTYRSIDSYVSHPHIHIHKPHGSVGWRLAATWNQAANHWLRGQQGLYKAIDEAATLDWHDDEFRVQNDEEYQDTDDATKVWLPALSIPVRRKTAFTMPETHRAAMLADLRNVTIVVAVGWRARERHFLKLLQDELPSLPSRLVAVAENVDAAQETVDNVWETGRFGSYAISSLGFSGFAELPNSTYSERATEDRTMLHLRDVLSGGSNSGIWTNRRPGAGMVEDEDRRVVIDPGYVEV